MAHEYTTDYLKDALFTFRQYKRFAERAIEQVSDQDFFRPLDPEANSIAVILRHLAGNMRSRWTDFLNTDGEKPERNRAQEFELPSAINRQAVMDEWEHGWSLVFAALEPLAEADLARQVVIRQEPYSVMQAIHWQVAHYCSHIGQVILLAKHYQGREWKTLSVPKKAPAQMTQKSTK